MPPLWKLTPSSTNHNVFSFTTWHNLGHRTLVYASSNKNYGNMSMEQIPSFHKEWASGPNIQYGTCWQCTKETFVETCWYFPKDFQMWFMCGCLCHRGVCNTLKMSWWIWSILKLKILDCARGDLKSSSRYAIITQSLEVKWRSIVPAPLL